jgi:hypothetical protein
MAWLILAYVVMTMCGYASQAGLRFGDIVQQAIRSKQPTAGHEQRRYRCAGVHRRDLEEAGWAREFRTTSDTTSTCAGIRNQVPDVFSPVFHGSDFAVGSLREDSLVSDARMVTLR